MKMVKCNLYPYSKNWDEKCVRSRNSNDNTYTAYSSNWSRNNCISWYYVWTYSICFNKHYIYSRLGSLR